MEITRIVMAGADPAAAAARVRAAFAAAGWRGTEAPLVFARGTRAGSVIGFSPAWWLARAAVVVLPAVDGARVEMRVTVSTAMQATSALERDFWDREVGALAAALGTDPPPPSSGRALAARALRQNIAATAIILGLPCACAVVPWLWFGSLRGFLAGAATGTALGLAWAAWRMKLRLK